MLETLRPVPQTQTLAPVDLSRSSLGEQMAFPDAEKSIVTKEKLCDYLLNPAHPVGGTKAAWFASVGYTRQNWEELRDDLLTIATSCENFIAKPFPYGVKYETVGEIGTDDRRPGAVVAVWIVEENSPPRLVTAYPGDT